MGAAMNRPQLSVKFDPRGMPMHEVIRLPIWTGEKYTYITVALNCELTDEVIAKLLHYLEFMRDLLSPTVGIRSDNTDAERLIL